MGMGMPLYSLGIIAVVFALGFGYIILFIASKTTGTLKTLGYTIGIGIMAVMAFLALGKIYMMGCSGPMMRGYERGSMSNKMRHPMMEERGDARTNAPKLGGQ